MEVGEIYTRQDNSNVSCIIVKLVEHLVHEYFVHVKVGERYLIFTKKEFDTMWTKNVLDN